MSNPTSQQLCAALNGDLKKAGPKVYSKAVNDEPRKVFTANMNGAVLEFSHNQPDRAYWGGFKSYGSGSRNRVRIKRTAEAAASVPA